MILPSSAPSHLAPGAPPPRHGRLSCPARMAPRWRCLAGGPPCGWLGRLLCAFRAPPLSSLSLPLRVSRASPLSPSLTSLGLAPSFFRQEHAPAGPALARCPAVAPGCAVPRLLLALLACCVLAGCLSPLPFSLCPSRVSLAGPRPLCASPSRVAWRRPPLPPPLRRLRPAFAPSLVVPSRLCVRAFVSLSSVSPSCVSFEGVSFLPSRLPISASGPFVPLSCCSSLLCIHRATV